MCEKRGQLKRGQYFRGTGQTKKKNKGKKRKERAEGAEGAGRGRAGGAGSPRHESERPAFRWVGARRPGLL